MGTATEVRTSRRIGGRLAGWPLVGWSALVVAALVVAILASRGAAEAGVRAIIRGTALTSLILFSSAFVAASLNRTWPSPLSRWMLVNRRYLGVSFAVSHFVHLVAIIRLTTTLPDFEPNPATVVGGGLAYVFIAAMTATSFDRSAAWIGRRAWRVLHTTGVYYIWLIFFITYLPRALQSPAYVPYPAVLLAALALRTFGRVRRP